MNLAEVSVTPDERDRRRRRRLRALLLTVTGLGAVALGLALATLPDARVAAALTVAGGVAAGVEGDGLAVGEQPLARTTATRASAGMRRCMGADPTGLRAWRRSANPRIWVS